LPDIKEIAIQKLSSDFKDNSLLDFVRWLDIEYSKEKQAMDQSLVNHIITRSIISFGYCVNEYKALTVKQFENIQKTIKAASAHVLFPNENNLNFYFAEATNSFPFGAGEGCYSVEAPGAEDPCGIGTGCRSGAGSLLASELDAELIFAYIQRDLIPWLKDEFDPVLIKECE